MNKTQNVGQVSGRVVNRLADHLFFVAAGAIAAELGRIAARIPKDSPAAGSFELEPGSPVLDDMLILQELVDVAPADFTAAEGLISQFAGPIGDAIRQTVAGFDPFRVAILHALLEITDGERLRKVLGALDSLAYDSETAIEPQSPASAIVNG